MLRPNTEKSRTLGKCHSGKGSKDIVTTVRHQTRHSCAEREVPLCDILCYDMHLHGMKIFFINLIKIRQGVIV